MLTSEIKPGESKHERYYSVIKRKNVIEYNYRTLDGVLYTTVAPDLYTCIARCEKWLKSTGRVE